MAKARAAHGPARILVNVAGILIPGRILGKDGPLPLEKFRKVIEVNLVGTFNMMRLAAADMAGLPPLADGERGVIIDTSSVAAYEGQIGQAAYAASKAGIVGLTLPAARDLARCGIRVLAIAPGLIATPMMLNLPPDIQKALGDSVPFPQRLGHAHEVSRAGAAHDRERAAERRGGAPRRRVAAGAEMTKRRQTGTVMQDNLPSRRYTAPPSLEDMEAMAAEAFASIPAELRQQCRNVVIRIDEFPDEETEREMELETPFDLLGLYRGVDLARKSVVDVARDRT